ncbi:hypothetical protein [Spirosoma sordidisoli]|uniref:Uncharacterized protein n=1 Tax=Spirosoma sordidisoli TaxID=2502893 RepID=A0A4Q2UJK5_9BACT|nr:hypothetical protein [Spirosoma sordidisoli]RYC69673.1 hypothetical protein EQG79_13815 [Spirosoma sordidisoli]
MRQLLATLSYGSPSAWPAPAYALATALWQQTETLYGDLHMADDPLLTAIVDFADTPRYMDASMTAIDCMNALIHLTHPDGICCLLLMGDAGKVNTCDQLGFTIHFIDCQQKAYRVWMERTRRLCAMIQVAQHNYTAAVSNWLDQDDAPLHGDLLRCSLQMQRLLSLGSRWLDDEQIDADYYVAYLQRLTQQYGEPRSIGDLIEM